ncbi:hypothetical protein BDP55DRAFT_683359 [Colletotrichum godetiae]|uniref:Uncharacterized protein n=1 Tax=Colletotrichum godetiae TaxID=1209918 RepID=A0AAJ0A8Y9_9PEZI|nr:uncharacterized protein BDP55DRAFT_683359 [Colletotrichum godetiae]KAK1658214.1 hypothetical protein BDP55DRAFT_683359 [Colletotrichum godetiae]
MRLYGDFNYRSSSQATNTPTNFSIANGVVSFRMKLGAGNRAILIPGYGERRIHDMYPYAATAIRPCLTQRAESALRTVCYATATRKTWLRRRRSAQRHFTTFVSVRATACSRNQPDNPRGRLWNVSINPNQTCLLPCLDLREISCCKSGHLDAGENSQRQDRRGDPYIGPMQLRDKPVSRLARLRSLHQINIASRIVDDQRQFTNVQITQLNHQSE